MFFKDEGESTDTNFLDIYSTPTRLPKPTQIRSQRKPSISYAELISEALERSELGMLTLKEIYYYISHHYPYFNMNKTGWQNSIRHNLSLNKAFYKVPRGMGNPGKGSYWKINYEFATHKQGYRAKRLSSRTCSKMNSDGFMSQQGFLENIGVTEMISKSNITSVFDGNLASLYENVETNETHLESRNANNIFSFKK
ncbi:forkhead box protein [Vairimorpha necatrix]|uniref:Forkhead box protein n=1 Tax=Vairimorpha necatrix TaxID=6039 RepID=A0AAX4JD48_9MICR